MPHRTKPIIAVFGSWKEDTLEFAEELGRQLASRAILLTGGSNDPDEINTVKERAIRGAIEGKAGGPPALWIGVDQSGEIGHDEDNSASSNGLIIHTHLQNRRNALEACLCDAAIVLDGGNGTASEAAFTLSRGKPVAFVGEHWKKQFDLDQTETKPANWKKLVETGFKKVEPIDETHTPLHLMFDRARLPDTIEKCARWNWWTDPPADNPTELAKAAGAVIDWIFDQNPEILGEFPSLIGYDNVKTAYDGWLAAALSISPHRPPDDA